MSAKRRTVLGAAMATPLLARFAGTASGAAADDTWGTVSDGWVEIRWTAEAQAELNRLGAVVEATAPALLITDSGDPGVRFPVRSGSGDPSLTDLPAARGEGALDGGLTVRARNGVLRVESLESVLRDGVASGTCVVNGVDVGHRALFRCGLADGVLSTENVPVGSPMRVRVGEVPLHATQELLDAYTESFGAPLVTADTLLARVTAEGLYTPPGA
ncbi:hypothetical protein [Streptomyces sp. RFCAC02]|uniref:hypothetical protein n=1 Tax=Streptomyces sp. RFCAC02 TaxID=2499143 RepID=UPI0010205735|nr:hypothetical protein [Streptomyces sp. RFCAC02]